MGYSIIPSSAEVDNVTIDKNAAGEIEIKGGAVTGNLLDISVCDNSSILLNSNKLEVGNLYSVGNTFLFGKSTGTGAGSDSNIWVTANTITFKKSLTNVRLGLHVWGNYNIYTLYRILKNGNVILSGSRDGYSGATNVYVDTPINTNDIITFQCTTGTNYNSAGGINNTGVYGTLQKQDFLSSNDYILG